MGNDNPKKINADFSVAFVGSGNVAHHFIPLFKKAGFLISGLHSRNIETGQKLAFENQIPFISSLSEIQADLVFVCVKDKQVEEVVKSISHQTSLVAYTAGSIELKNFHEENVAVFYPLQTFSKNRNLTVEAIPILLETKSKGICDLLQEIAKQVGFESYYCDSTARQKVHLSAVFLNNFTHHLIQISSDLATKFNLDWQMFEPLLKETAAKWEQKEFLENQTGPARRNDINVIEKHLNQLEEMNKAVYSVLTESIRKTYWNEEL